MQEMSANSQRLTGLKAVLKRQTYRKTTKRLLNEELNNNCMVKLATRLNSFSPLSSEKEYNQKEIIKLFNT